MIHYTFEIQTKDQRLWLLHCGKMVTVHTKSDGMGLYYGAENHMLLSSWDHPDVRKIRTMARKIVVNFWGQLFDEEHPKFRLVNLKTSKTEE